MTSLINFQRFLPKEGVQVYPNVFYYDINDIDHKLRMYYKQFFEYDKEYRPLTQRGRKMDRGKNINKKYCSYIYKDDNLVGLILLFEYLDNPDGYGKNDYRYTKLIMPEYRGTKYSRYCGADIMHMVFVSGLAKRLYTYAVANKLVGTYVDQIDLKAPCMGEVYESDGPIQEYMKITKKLKTPYGPYVILEFNGETYNKMDLKKYFLAAPGRTEEVAIKWIKEMDHAASIMKETIKNPEV